ncbi:MAG: AAA family ATPase, partial [Dehalococcoides mccartyi]
MPERIMDLFDAGAEKLKKSQSPLAARMRPEGLSEFVGQDHLIGEGRALRLAIEGDKIPSLIFWGPPGSGKTTLANIIARRLDAYFSALSAVSAGVADLRRVVEEARERLKFERRRTILFIDEIHRFNKSQQDAILPYVEDGTVVLIGATTENPSFEVNSALLSRAQVYVLNPLSEKEISLILKRSLKDPSGLGNYHARLLEE